MEKTTHLELAFFNLEQVELIETPHIYLVVNNGTLIFRKTFSFFGNPTSPKNSPNHKKWPLENF